MTLTFTKALTLLYLDEKDKIKYLLIIRYYEKVSPRLLAELKEIERKALENGHKMMEYLSRMPGGFISHIKKDSIWQGGYIHVPFGD